MLEIFHVFRSTLFGVYHYPIFQMRKHGTKYQHVSFIVYWTCQKSGWWFFIGLWACFKVCSLQSTLLHAIWHWMTLHGLHTGAGLTWPPSDHGPLSAEMTDMPSWSPRQRHREATSKSKVLLKLPLLLWKGPLTKRLLLRSHMRYIKTRGALLPLFFGSLPGASSVWNTSLLSPFALPVALW